MEAKVIPIGNMMPRPNFNWPQDGAVYSIAGLAPGVVRSGGGDKIKVVICRIES